MQGPREVGGVMVSVGDPLRAASEGGVGQVQVVVVWRGQVPRIVLRSWASPDPIQRLPLRSSS